MDGSLNKVTVGLAQMYPRLNDVAANLETHLELMKQAAEQGAQLLVFPELSLTGYYLKDLIYEVSTPPRSEVFQTLCEQSRQLDIDVVVGFVDVSRRGNHFIASAYIGQGEVLHVHHKVYLPTYTMFDDGRFFARGEHIRAFDTRFGRMGMLICEDFWHVSTGYLLWLDGADVFLFQSASPGRDLGPEDQLGTATWVNNVLQVYGTLYTTFVVHCNRVGFEDGEGFWGGSALIDPDGRFVQQGPYFDEALVVAEMDLDQIRRTRSLVATLRDERPLLTARELERILRDRGDRLR